jgi:hypothetical protein
VQAIDGTFTAAAVFAAAAAKKTKAALSVQNILKSFIQEK